MSGDLEQSILSAIQRLVKNDSKFPSFFEIYHELELRGIRVTGAEVRDALKKLEEEGKIARPPYYYVV